jgi:pimeloyl-ACP methyl ester carboxylesterase
MRAAGALAGDVLAAAPGLVRDTHRAISGRVFGALGPAADPVRVMHDGIAGAVYGSLRLASAAAPRIAVRAAEGVSVVGGPVLPSSRLGRMAHGAVNGMWGDRLAERHPALALSMCLRVDGCDVPALPSEIRAAYAGATGRIVVFVHGWCDNAESWQRHALQRNDRVGEPIATVDYGTALQRDLGYAPVYVRYNTGLHISDNGRALAELMQSLHANWPVPVETIALVGHSMGGLVARSACHAGVSQTWTRDVRHVICLGSPHLGAPLEKGVNALAWALARVPETQGLARLINLRSRGVKDLRYGSCAELDWQGVDPDEFLRDRCTEVPFLPNATYCFVGATVSAAPGSVVGRLVGDVLVLWPSAAGRGRRRQIPFAPDRGQHLGGMHHLELLNSPRAYPLLRDWLDEAAE